MTENNVTPIDAKKRAEKLNENATDPSKAEIITFLTLFGTGIAGFAALIWAETKAEKKRIEDARLERARRKQLAQDLEDWINEMENAGNKVYKLQDGRYFTVDDKAVQTMHIKRLS